MLHNSRRLYIKLSTGGRTGLFMLLAITIIAIGAPFLSSHSHEVISGPQLSAPGPNHFLGTDDLGVDIWAQICFGARISLIIGLGTALISGIFGIVAGILSGYVGGLTDTILMRIVDVITVIPDLPVIIVIAAFFGPGTGTIIVVLSLFSWVHPARVIRSGVISLRTRRYIQSAEMNGAGFLYLMLRHFLPEIFPIAVVSMIRISGKAIVAEAGLSFLGLGDPTSRSWGLIIHHAISFPAVFYTKYWLWWLLSPWTALTLMVLSIALLGRDVEKITDPGLNRIRRNRSS